MMVAPTTRILSWTQLVLEADPNFRRQSLQPWVFQFSNGRLFIDTIPTYTPFAAGLANDGGVLILDDFATGWPTSPGAPGTLYSNGGVVTISPGFAPIAGPPVYFPQTGSQQLLAFNGALLPVTRPAVGSQQLWDAYGEVWVA